MREGGREEGEEQIEDFSPSPWLSQAEASPLIALCTLPGSDEFTHAQCFVGFLLT